MIKFVSDLRHVGGFSGSSGFLHSKFDRHDITEILLKVALNTTKQTNIYLIHIVSADALAIQINSFDFFIIMHSNYILIF